MDIVVDVEQSLVT